MKTNKKANFWKKQADSFFGITVSNIIGSSLALLLLTTSNNCKANALVINGLTVTQASKRVTFNISWKNSWYTSYNPFNWDAAWVFVKFRQCGAAPSTDWSHGLVSTTMSDHIFPANLEPTLSDGSAVGIDPSPDNTGAMIRRKAYGVYPNAAAASVTLTITNIPAVVVGIEYDVKIFGIEMVFVPTGAFYAGDGGTYGPNANLGYEFCTQGVAGLAVGTVVTPYSISSEAGFTINSPLATTVAGAAPYNVAVVNGATALHIDYPKGYNAFFCMKYEISSEQFAEFLNTITANAGTALFPANFNTNRNRLNNTGTAPSIYITDRPNRAQNFLTWKHVSSYFDWACLRPMSELEYEKAARGQGPAIDLELAWGNATLEPAVASALTISTTVPSEDGTELAIGPVGINCNWTNGGLAMVGGDAGNGPLRVGIFADVLDSTRMLSGASYYGIMEMTGNLMEYYVPATPFYQGTLAAALLPQGLAGGPSGNTLLRFIRTWGDGYIDVNSGNHDVFTVGAVNTGWPPALLGYGGCATAGPNSCYLCCRGGAWNNAQQELRVSDRYYVNNVASINGANFNRTGGRGAR